MWTELKAMCHESLQEESIGHGPWYMRGEEPWPGVITGVMARFVRRAPKVVAAAEVRFYCRLFVCVRYVKGMGTPPTNAHSHTQDNNTPPQDEALLSSLLQSCPYFEARANAANMLGGLSQLPAEDDAAVRAARVEAAGALLKGALGGESHVMVLAAVLDAVMDLFADDDLHPVFARLGLLPLLKEVLPKVRSTRFF